MDTLDRQIEGQLINDTYARGYSLGKDEGIRVTNKHWHKVLKSFGLIVDDNGMISKIRKEE